MRASSSSVPPSWRSVTARWKPTSITGFADSIFPCQVSSASAKVWPLPWMQKSTWQVVPPNAAETVPEVKSSQEVVPPKGMSRCVCGSMQPGSTIFPAASITLSAWTSSDSPISVTDSSSTNTSAT